ncbi:MAG: DUF5320 domain-containing protein [Patescibacteria group bacterium]
MPAFDQTGPQGNGQLTGLGLGKCPSKTRPTRAFCRFHRGRGLGLGRVSNQNPSVDQLSQEDELRSYQLVLQQELEVVNRKLTALAKSS